MLTQQHYKISNENRHESKLSASGTEHFPTRMEEKCEENDNNFNSGAWIKPKSVHQQLILSWNPKIKKSMIKRTTKLTCW